jgi:tetratricopeptide (TPR) repeat protein
VSPDRIDSYVRRFWNYLAWDGGTSRAEGALAEAPLPDSPEVAFCKAYSRYLARDFRGALQVLTQAGADAQLAPFRSVPRELLECRFLDAAGDRPAVERACSAALSIQQSQTAGGPTGLWLRMATAQAFAALGRRAEAEGAAREAAASCPISHDAFDGAAVALLQAQVLTRTGDLENASSLLERLLSIPSPTSVAWLRLDPGWEPLRVLPRFKAILGAPPSPHR